MKNRVTQLTTLSFFILRIAAWQEADDGLK